MTSIDRAREAIRRCRELATLSESAEGTTRTFLSRPMRDVHSRLANWMSAAGMAVRIDAAGNIRGTYSPSADARTRRLIIGSHLDTVPNAGAFDGILGVVLGVGLVESLEKRNLPFSIEVAGFSDEEGVRFGLPFIGSRALTATLDAAMLAREDERGRSVEAVIREYGLDPARIPDAVMDQGSFAYLEFHIEQGPVLDDMHQPLAVVETIVGQSRATVTFIGMANHAGTTPMRSRRDALAAAAEWMGEVERLAMTEAGVVATVGRIVAEPGAGNVVPGRCVLSLDARHASDSVRQQVVERFQNAARDIAARRRLETAWELRLDQSAVAMDPELTTMLATAVERAGSPVHRMASGAGHDAMIIATRVPAAMLFIRCDQGISHHPAESVREEDVAAALDAGGHFVDEVERSVRA